MNQEKEGEEVRERKLKRHGKKSYLLFKHRRKQKNSPCKHVSKSSTFGSIKVSRTNFISNEFISGSKNDISLPK